MAESSEKLVTASIFGFGQTAREGYLILQLFWSVRPYPEYVYEKVNLYFTDGEVLENVDLLNEKEVVVPERVLNKKIRDVKVLKDISHSEKPVVSDIYRFYQNKEEIERTAALLDSKRPHPGYKFKKVTLQFENGEVLKNLDLIDEREVTVPERFMIQKLKTIRPIISRS